ncbi:MAG: hypothetical protein PUF50_06520 [Erysipelotrichaceae bacterium]|nr:hypothetical protein [Erysipelotrichaceae bacterium]
MKKEQMDIAKALYQLGMELDVIQSMTQVNSTHLLYELKKESRK